MATPTAAGQGATATPTTNPMATHVKVVAILDFVLGGFLLLMALGMLLAFGIGTAAVADAQQYGAPSWVAQMMATLGVVLSALFGLAALLSIVAAIRLMGNKRSAKGLAMAAAVVHVIFGLLGVMMAGLGLIGLVAGIYMIVILVNNQTDAVLVN